MDRIFRVRSLSTALAHVCMVGFIVAGVYFLSFGQQVGPLAPSGGTKKNTEEHYRQAWFDTLYPYTKIVRETGNMRNDNWAIKRFNGELGYPLNASYCSTSGMWAARKVGMRFKGVNGMAYSWRQKDKLVFYPAMLKGNSRIKPMISRMDAVIFTFSHVEYAVMRGGGIIYTDKGIYTIGCNTRGGGNRIEGCYYPIFRDWSMVRGVYNHVGPWYQSQ